MNVPDKRARMIKHIEELEEDAVLALVEERVNAGDDPLAIIEDAKEGMRLVGVLYENQRYFISGLMMAGEIFREVMELVEPILVQQLSGDESGHILLATVQGDIHDIGKNIFNIMLRCYGFNVTDLGEDIPPDVLVAKVQELQPDIIGLSGVLTVSYDSMRAVVKQIRRLDNDQLAATPVVIGGGLINEKVCVYVGADYWATDAINGVEICKQILNTKSMPS